MGKAQRTKGAVGEREWIKLLAARGIQTKRNLDQTRDGGGDVKAPPFLFEVKRRKGLAVRAFLEQARTAVNDGVRGTSAPPLTPVVAMREDGNTNWMVLLDADDFLNLVASTRQMGWTMGGSLNDAA